MYQSNIFKKDVSANKPHTKWYLIMQVPPVTDSHTLSYYSTGIQKNQHGVHPPLIFIDRSTSSPPIWMLCLQVWW